MATFETTPDKLKKQADKLSKTSQLIKKHANEIHEVRNAIHLSDGESAAIKKQLDRIYDAVVTRSDQVNAMSGKLLSIATLYSTTEKQITGTKIAKAQVPSAKDSSNKDPWYNSSGAVISGTVANSGTILGISRSGSASGELLGYSTDTKLKALEFGWKKDSKTGKMEFEDMTLVEAGFTAEGHLAKGNLKGSLGYLNGEIEGEVGVASIGGTVAASLYKDGKLSPQLNAEAKAEAKGLTGSAKGSVGTEENNIYVKGEGTVGEAEAKAGVNAGKVTYKDKSGKEITGYGVSASAKAEAYAAEGTVSGGITIFGIDIDVSATGKAGGAGIGAEGGVSTGGVAGSVTAGVLLGAEIGISVDWTNFSLIKKKK